MLDITKIKDFNLKSAVEFIFDDTDIKIIDLNILKKRYKDKVKSFHPDLFFNQPDNIITLKNEQMSNLNLSFQLLKDFISKEGVRSGPPKMPLNHRKSSVSGKVYIPKVPLKIGEFLYYSKVVTLKQLSKALVWQKNQRSKIGEIALRWGWLTKFELGFYLTRKRNGELFGETLLRYNKISEYKLRVLLKQQEIEQPKICKYFIQNKIIDNKILFEYLNTLKEHNIKYSKQIKNKIYITNERKYL